MSALIVQISRRISRQLDLQKGMFFDRDMLDELAACGVVDLIHKEASDRQREEAARRRAESEEREAERYGLAGAPRGTTPGERGTFTRRQTHGLRLVDAQEPSEDGREALARVRRLLRKPNGPGSEALQRARRMLDGPKPRKEK